MEWPWKKLWLVLVGTIALVQVFGSSNGCFPEEKGSLLEFKAAYSNESLLPSWVDDPNSNCCDWERVTCDSSSGNVFNLSLDYLKRIRVIRGYCLDSARLNWSLFLSFKELRSLNLSDNCFDDFIWKEGTL